MNFNEEIPNELYDDVPESASYVTIVANMIDNENIDIIFKGGSLRFHGETEEEQGGDQACQLIIALMARLRKDKDFASSLIEWLNNEIDRVETEDKEAIDSLLKNSNGKGE